MMQRMWMMMCLTTAVSAQHTLGQDAVEQQGTGEQLDAIIEDESWSLRDMRLRDSTIYWENDGTVANLVDDTDQFYTNGVGLELSFDPNLTSSLRDKLAPAGEWSDPRFGFGVALKQRIYTSEFITQPNPPADDHPYGGYLYFSFSFQRADNTKHDHFGLDLGVVGDASGARGLQEFIHRAYPGEDDPEGWGTQLANELAINFNYTRTWRSEKAELWGMELEMLPSLGFQLGNVAIMGHGKMTLRAGHNLPNDFGPATFLGHKDHTAQGADWGKGDFSFYLYTSVGADAVGRDIFLDGNTFADSRSTDSEPFVARVSVGAVMRYKCVYAGWAQNFETERFESQPSGHMFGSLVLGYSYRF